MSRSGYVDDYEYINLYRATVDRTIAGKKGQSFLKEMAAAMDAMPEKKLISGELVDPSGAVCAIGSVCKARGLDVSKVDYDDPDSVANAVGISRTLAAEIEYVNDEYRDSYLYQRETPEQRWERMRQWLNENITRTNIAND